MVVLTIHKTTIFSFTFMPATLYLKVLNFTTTFLFSVYSTSPFRFQFVAFIKSYLSFFLLHNSMNLVHCSQTNQSWNIKSHWFQAVAHDCTFSIYSPSALHFDLTVGSCWPIQLILVLLNTVASLSANLAIWNSSILTFQQITCFKNLEAYLVSPCLKLNSFLYHWESNTSTCSAGLSLIVKCTPKLLSGTTFFKITDT